MLLVLIVFKSNNNKHDDKVRAGLRGYDLGFCNTNGSSSTVGKEVGIDN